MLSALILIRLSQGWTLYNRGSVRSPMWFMISPNSQTSGAGTGEWVQVTAEEAKEIQEWYNQNIEPGTR